MIQGVTVERAGIGFTNVKVMTAADTVDFRVTKGDADHIKSTIANLMLQGPTPAPTPVMTPPTAEPVSVADELKKLAELRDAGILSAEEFDVQKARLLG
jgi:hypothetical protein